MKVLFVDFDGVCNCAECWRKGIRDSKGLAALSPEHVERLNRIVKETNCFIVISSTWRRFHTNNQNKDFLIEAGFMFPEKILGCTPKEGFSTRGEEIQEWMDCWHNNLDHEKVDKFIILDDLPIWEFESVQDHLIQTTWENGLLDNHVEECISKLNGE